MTRYPKQIWSVWGRTSSSVSATYELVAPKEDGNTSPLEFHEGNLSRFVLTCLDNKDGAFVPHIVNVPATDIPLIKSKTDIAMMLKESYKLNPHNGTASPDTEASASANGLCYTEKLRFGPHKGKTPAEVVMLEGGEVALMEAGKVLSEHLAQYPKNQTLIDAINEAINLAKTGELKKVEKSATPITSSNSMVVYDVKYKSTTRQHNGPENTFLCYDFNITCNFDMQYPWTFTFVNYCAPKKGNRVESSQATNYKKAIFRMDDASWLHAVDQFVTLKHEFEDRIFDVMLDRAETWAKQQAEANRR